MNWNMLAGTHVEPVLQEGAMNVSRRDVVVAGAFAFGAANLLTRGSVDAQGGDEAAAGLRGTSA
jgi:hypothetical protein